MCNVPDTIPSNIEKLVYRKRIPAKTRRTAQQIPQSDLWWKACAQKK